MDATLVQPYKRLFLPPRINRRVTVKNHRRSPFILSVLTDNISDTSSPHESKNVYNDNWFDRIAIHHVSHALQTSTGLRNNKSGYDGMVEAATMASRHFTPIQQRQLVLETLDRAFPRPILNLIKTLLPPSKFAREYYAAFTKIFFPWLVGPCEVRESEFEGRKEKNVVHIKKCRFLEATNCVGICTNLCKMPSQVFVKEAFGMSLNMVPNFDDMSCEMIYGEEPLPQSLDPAFTQPCYKQCKSTRRHQKSCTD